MTPKPLLPLTDEQMHAAAPDTQIWLSASAGTGKTQVLAARVLRLLLAGNHPESILCLTFTKAGATEMASRVHQHLAAWVRSSDKFIHRDLVALGAPRTAADIAYARTLFARVLDARGGGLQIQTIHSFCQTILAGFPAEADLAPGFRALEERSARQLADTVLADMISDAVNVRDVAFLDRLNRLVLDIGDSAVKTYLLRCAHRYEALERLSSGVEAQVRMALGISLSDVEADISVKCADSQINRAALEELRTQNRTWGTKSGLANADVISNWLEANAETRTATLAQLMKLWRTADGNRKSTSKGQAPQTGTYAALCDELDAYFGQLIALRKAQDLAHRFTDALLVGQHYARAYAAAKAAQGVVDFDDLIDRTAALLTQPGIGDWIRFKLDRRIDHILVDEAQDTNDKQWRIVRALAEEFYAGSGAKGDRLRTIFTVGDTKQSIFGFQGSDPQAMVRARHWFARQVDHAGQDLRDLTLQGSFRSSPPILTLVDAVIETLSPDKLGLDEKPLAHVSQRGTCGVVELVPPIRSATENADAVDAPEESDSSGDEESAGHDTDLKPDIERDVARQVAQRVAAGWAGGLNIEDRKAQTAGETRAVEPRDFMILLRRRSNLARLIVAQLTEAGVPVAGVDRLRLNTPLVVRDMLAALHFALQPNDDLNLACLLVSPLLGWSQERLQTAALARGRLSLWRYLRATEPEEDLQPLRTIMRLGDRLPPAQYLEALLSGPLRAREKCLARFGPEARDPLDELLNAAFRFERDHPPTLQGFVNWFESDTDDIKRDGETGENAVRVLTVHGAKGLQAPIVILADATTNPEKKRDAILDWDAFYPSIPVPIPRKELRVDVITSAIEATRQRELQEHWRLLYVALTRAEERLIVMGGLNKGDVSPNSWYSAVERAMDSLDHDTCSDGTRIFGIEAPATSKRDEGERHKQPLEALSGELDQPTWLVTPAPSEVRPARPLSPSRLTDDTTVDPPLAAARAQAAERGRRLHALFERLPDIDPISRRRIADAWLATAEGMTVPAERAELIDITLAVINDPRFAHIFAAEALAEAPLAGVVNDVVVAGTVDRLIVTSERVVVCDYKTTQRPPRSVANIPEAHLRQMAAYTAVLAQMFPDRPVDAALLYTSAPVLFTLDAAMLAPFKPSYQLEQQVLAIAT